MRRTITSDAATGLPEGQLGKVLASIGRGRDVIHLEVGDPDFKTPPHIIEAANRAALQGDTHYTGIRGIRALREAIAAKFDRENGIKCDPSTEVIVGIGATGVLFLACVAALNPGDEVIVADPYWPYYEGHVALPGASLVCVPLRKDSGFTLDVDELRSRVTPRTKMVILNSPNNPTGSILHKDTLLKIGEIAEEYDLLIVSDEVYEKFIFDGEEHFSLGSVPELKERVLTVNALSKTYAMTGWRLGYACGPKPLIDAMVSVQEYMVSCVPSMIQRAGVAALTGPQDVVGEMARVYKRRRDLVFEGLNAIPGVKCVKPKGAFYAFPDISAFGMSSFDFAVALGKKAGVSVVHGAGMGKNGEGHIRISYSTSDENLVEALARIKGFAEGAICQR
ncbi:MAG: pyridoxal phosphate-dependent aminotransferase [Bacillota bacterium]|jgi:aspartate/methionine/tyrosine aminotransferase